MANHKVLQVLQELKKSANINNTNNTNNNNNTNDTNNELTTTTHCHHSNEKEVEVMATPSLGRLRLKEESLDSKPKEKVALELPGEWRGVKLDLFCNGTNKDGSPSMKLNIGVIRKIDGEQVALQASLNSSWDSGVRRGVDVVKWNTDSHWIRVKQLRKELEYVYNPRYSKIGLKQRAGGTEMVAFVYQTHASIWCVDIVREAQVHSFELTDPLSQAQIEKNMIASLYAGVKKRALITVKELGI